MDAFMDTVRSIINGHICSMDIYSLKAKVSCWQIKNKTEFPPILYLKKWAEVGHSPLLLKNWEKLNGSKTLKIDEKSRFLPICPLYAHFLDI